MKETKHIITDSTESYGGGRIPTTTYFKTIWSKDIKLLQYFSSWGRQDNMKIESLANLDRKDKLAIARHKKILMKKLGLIKEPLKVKVIYWSTCPTNFFTDLAIEKENTFQTAFSRWDKNYCVLWTKEKEELIEEYKEIEEQRNKELTEIKNKIMYTDKSKQGG